MENGLKVNNILEKEKNLVPFNTIEEKTWVRSLLGQQVMTVDFVKKNGDRRVMVCTLSESLIPKDQLPKGKKEKKEDKDSTEDKLCAVYDINAKGWRSFTWDKVNKIHYGEIDWND